MVLETVPDFQNQATPDWGNFTKDAQQLLQFTPFVVSLGIMSFPGEKRGFVC